MGRSLLSWRDAWAANAQRHGGSAYREFAERARGLTRDAVIVSARPRRAGARTYTACRRGLARQCGTRLVEPAGVGGDGSRGVAIVLVAFYVALAAILYFTQRSMMYFPETIHTTPAQAGLPERRRSR